MKKKEILIPKTVILLIFIILVVTLTLLFKSIAFSKKTIDSGFEGLDISKSKNYEIPISYYYYGIQNKNLDAFLKAYPEFMNVKNRFSQNDFDKFYDVFKDECGENINLKENKLHLDLNKMKKSDYMLQVFASYVDLGSNNKPLESCLSYIDLLYKEVEKNKNVIQ